MRMARLSGMSRGEQNVENFMLCSLAHFAGSPLLQAFLHEEEMCKVVLTCPFRWTRCTSVIPDRTFAPSGFLSVVGVMRWIRVSDCESKRCVCVCVHSSIVADFFFVLPSWKGRNSMECDVLGEQQAASGAQQVF